MDAIKRRRFVEEDVIRYHLSSQTDIPSNSMKMMTTDGWMDRWRFVVGTGNHDAVATNRRYHSVGMDIIVTPLSNGLSWCCASSSFLSITYRLFQSATGGGWDSKVEVQRLLTLEAALQYERAKGVGNVRTLIDFPWTCCWVDTFNEVNNQTK